MANILIISHYQNIDETPCDGKRYAMFLVVLGLTTSHLKAHSFKTFNAMLPIRRRHYRPF
jgi:hypothetical protein